MKLFRTCLNLFFALACMPASLAMEPVEPDPMEIDEPEQKSRVETLETLCFRRIVKNLSDYARNPKIDTLIQEHSHDIFQHWMFGENDEDLHRNPAIIWLMAKCPITKSEPCRFNERLFATPLVECNDMKIVRTQDPCEALIERAQKPLFSFFSEEPIKHAQFSADGSNIYFASMDKTITILSTKSEDIVNKRMLQSRLRMPKFISLNPNNMSVLCGSANILKLYDVITGDPLCDIVRGHLEMNMINRVGFSPDGNKVYVLHDVVEEIENIDDHLNATAPAAVMADVYDISEANKILKLLPSLTLKQLAAIECLYKLANHEEEGTTAKSAEIKELCASLPQEIATVLAASFAKSQPSSSALKRRKTESCMF